MKTIKEILELANIVCPYVGDSIALLSMAGAGNVIFEKGNLATVFLNGKEYPVSFNGEKWETGWI